MDGVFFLLLSPYLYLSFSSHLTKILNPGSGHLSHPLSFGSKAHSSPMSLDEICLEGEMEGKRTEE